MPPKRRILTRAQSKQVRLDDSDTTAKTRIHSDSDTESDDANCMTTYEITTGGSREPPYVKRISITSLDKQSWSVAGDTSLIKDRLSHLKSVGDIEKLTWDDVGRCWHIQDNKLTTNELVELVTQLVRESRQQH